MTIGIFVCRGGGGRGFGAGLAEGGGGVEICVTNYLARLTPSLRANFEVEKMSDFSVCLRTALT